MFQTARLGNILSPLSAAFRLHLWPKYQPGLITDYLFFFSLAPRGKSGSAAEERGDGRSHLAVVACGPRLEETLTMLKSAVLLSNKPLHFHIFAEDDLHDSFKNAVSVPRQTQQFLCTLCVADAQLSHKKA